MNKNEFINVLCKDLLKKEMRDNVIVLGDLLTDLDMVTNSNHSNVISVGWLNDMKKNGHDLDIYLDNFDIVITNDGPFTAVNEILKSVLNK